MGLNPLNLIRVMPAKERELSIGQAYHHRHWRRRCRPRLRARARRARRGRRGASSAAARWARAPARGWRAACWRRGASAPPPSPRSSTWGAPSIAWWAERFPGTVRHGSLVVAQPRDPPDLTRFAAAHRALRMAGRGPHRRARARSRAAASGARCSFPTRPISIRGGRWLSWRNACRAAALPIRFGVELAPQDARRRYRRRLPRACRARRAARPARRARRDGRRALARRVAGAAGAHAASAPPALHRAARRRPVHDRRHHDRKRAPRPVSVRSASSF